MQWLLVGLVMSLKSSHKEAVKKPLLYEDYSDITSPTSNHISNIDIAVSIAITLFKILFLTCMFNYLILHFNCDMKSNVLLL